MSQQARELDLSSCRIEREPFYAEVRGEVGLFTIASDRPQNRLRQPSTSPTAVCGPRKAPEPVASSAMEKRAEMKSSFTASRVVPCSVKRCCSESCAT